ncbi:MAG: DMT family transporter [Fusobacterium necrophorum]|nr:DMT family transporter [Fusobacterium necrophorum]MDY6172489.1 DMT family transporter [Fusobacterium necrophorum]
MIRKDTIKKYTTKFYAFSAVFFWASAFVSTKIVLHSGQLSAMDLGTLRYFFAGILLIPLAFFCTIRLPDSRDLPKFAISGILGYTAYMFFFNTASTMISPSTASVINAICPGLTAVFAYFLFSEKISWKGILGLFISFVGILFLSLWNGSFSLNIGILYMFAAAICLSMYNVSQRAFVQRYNAMETMTYCLLAGSFFLLLCHGKSLLLIPRLSQQMWGHLLYLAIFPSILSYYYWAKAMQCCQKTTEVTNFMFVTPMIATLLSFLMIQEFPTWSTYFGGGLILLGMVLFQIEKIKK